MRQGHTKTAKRKPGYAQSFLLAVLLLTPCAFGSQDPPVSQPPTSSRSGAAAREMSAEEIFKRFASRILFLTCEESAGGSSLASGVLVSADGFIVTNAHVVESCRSMSATYISGASRRSYEPVLKYYDEQRDTAVLKIPTEDVDFFHVLGRPARIGERVYAIGNPRGLEQSISEGIVSGNREEDGVPWIQHSAPISPGSSGGALISSGGELLGINSRFRRESQNLNFAVPAATLAGAVSRARALTGVLDFPPDAEAQLNLGFLYYEGKGVPRDYAQAIVWLRKAAEQGNAEAQLSLGAAYEMGKGVQQDDAEAAAWYRKAAERGNALVQNHLAEVQNHLGRLYAAGKGVLQDDAEAAKWFRRAADQGNVSAQLSLGAAYLYGLGVPQDYDESYFWVLLAAAGKASGAKPEEIGSLLDGIASHLTTAALAQAQQWAREWLAAHATRAQ
jgi:TPR repeat protein